MEFLLISGMLVCGWVFLCVLSGERERRNREIELQSELLPEAGSPKPADRSVVDRTKN